MKKKVIFISSGAVLASAVIAVSCAFFVKGPFLKPAIGTDQDYTLTINGGDITHETEMADAHGDVQLVTDATKSAAPAEQNKVKFNYYYAPYSVDGSSVEWNYLTQNSGWLANDIESPIGTMKSLKLVGSGTAIVSWGWLVDGDILCESSTTISGNGAGETTNFNGKTPNYFQISAPNYNTVGIKQIVITYDKSCSRDPGPYYADNGLLYKDYDDGTVELLGFSGSSFATVNIPQNVNGKTVVSIHEYAFRSDSTITSVTIPNTVTMIGTDAFYDDANLAEVNFQSGSSPLSTGNYPFGGTTSLTGEFVIPTRMANSIGRYSFDEMEGVTAFRFEDNYDAGNFKCVDGVIYEGNTQLHTYPRNKADTEFNVPSTVTSFNDCVGMRGNKHIKKVIFNNTSPLTLKEYVLADCPELSEVHFNGSKSVTLEWYVFSGSTKLRDIVLPANTVVNGRTFANIGADASHPVNVFFESNNMGNWNANPAQYNGYWYKDMGAYVNVYIKSDSAIAPGDLPNHVTGSFRYEHGNIPMAHDTRTIYVQSGSTYESDGGFMGLWCWDTIFDCVYFGDPDGATDYLYEIEVPQNFNCFMLLKLQNGTDPTVDPYTMPEDVLAYSGSRLMVDDDLITINSIEGANLGISTSKKA